MRILWKRLQADLKNILWKTVYCVITQFMLLFQEYTTEKRSTALSTSSENLNSHFILIVLKNKFINKLGRAGMKKPRWVYTEKGFRKNAKENM